MLDQYKEKAEEQEIGDLPDMKLSDADKLMDKVYEDYVNLNPRTHLRRDIPYNEMWQDYWWWVIVLPSQTYDAPSGAVGRHFNEMLTDLLVGIKAQKWNAERFIVFQIIILQRSQEVKKAKDVRRQLTWRMEAWQQGKFSRKFTLCQALTPEQHAKIFHRKMLQGREKGGILQPTNIDEKSCDLVETVLRSHHYNYTHTPNFVEVNITANAVKNVARRLYRNKGLGGTDSHALKNWLLRFGVASMKLWEALADFTDRLSNRFAPWAGYQALMIGRLCALDKCAGVRPLGVGETWRRAMAKILLLVAGAEAKNACGINQLCAGLEAGKESGINKMQALWDLHKMEEI
jgi:hypothetical protein